MRRTVVVTALALAAIATVACDAVTIVATTGPPATVPTTASTPTSTVPPIVECPGPGEFGEGGGIASVDGEGSDASHLGQISWDSSDQCESFKFEFETSEGAPATMVPDIEISHLESFQVLRIRMDIGATVVTDQLVETGLVDRLYVVQSLDGDMFVDLLLAAPAAARARVESSPARLIVDLRPGFAPFTGTAAVDDKVVVVSPPRGTDVDALTQFMGYAKAIGDDVRVIVTQAGTVVTETNARAAETDETWGEFRFEMGLPPGDASVFLGESNPQDGSLDGVTLDLTVS